MAQYIDKDALVAEIKRRKELVSDPILSGNDLMIGERNAFFNLLSFIDTLEVKEVDLEKEIEEWLLHGNITDTRYDDYCDNDIIKTAKHFFELGLNVQQNISINVTDIDKVFEENGVDPNSKEAKMFKESYYMALEKLKTQKGVENERTKRNLHAQ